jgi:hypothetical protein
VQPSSSCSERDTATRCPLPVPTPVNVEPLNFYCKFKMDYDYYKAIQRMPGYFPRILVAPVVHALLLNEHARPACCLHLSDFTHHAHLSA